MEQWCEHLDVQSKYTIVISLRVQTWVCPECGIHGASTETVMV